MLNKIAPLKEKVTQFKSIGENASTTFGYWLSFLKAVDLLLNLLRERTADFELHLKCTQELLPYLVAGERHLYAKWVPIYLKDMLELKSKNPQMHEYLKRGIFFSKDSRKKFNCVASDMALEQPINRDCKSSSGVVGFTQKLTALLRWMLVTL